MNDPVTARGGFWRRAIALLIDCIFIDAILVAVGLVLVGPTGGVIRLQSSIVTIGSCANRTADHAKNVGVTVPVNFNVTEARECTKSIFGMVYDRSLTIVETTKSGTSTIWRSVTVPLDGDGKPASRYFYLDSLLVFVLAAYMIWRETSSGQTLGKRLMGIRVRSLDGGSPSLRQASVRFLVRFLPFAVVALFLFVSQLTGLDANTMFGNIGLFLFGAAAVVVVALAISINFVMSAPYYQLPWHDRIAGTEVVKNQAVGPENEVAGATEPGKA